MSIWTNLRSWWWHEQRRQDLLILWPTCKKLAPDIDTARDVFMVHAAMSPCWQQQFGERLWDEVQKLT